MEKRGLPVLGLALAALLCALPVAYAQQTITNLSQLAQEAFSAPQNWRLNL
jgi:hypothetical protein